MNTQQEFQSIIDDLTGPSNPKVKKTIVIARVMKVRHIWEVEVDLPEGPPDLIDDIISQIDCEGIDWGKPASEEVLDCEDDFEVKS